jgi:citronellol/citronellal dehydrogenase
MTAGSGTSSGRGAELAGRTALITGASRGIGAAIATRFARAGANVVLFAKSGAGAARPSRLPGTVDDVAGRIGEAGGRALAVVGDLRVDEDIESAVARSVAEFGGLDIVVNNAAAFDTTPASSITMKRYDTLHAINTRGSFAVSTAALPHLMASPSAHLLSISPPLTIEPRWLGPHVAYTTAKYAMSLTTLGLAAELADEGIAANSLWPSASVATEAIQMILGEDVAAQRSRKPEVMADAALAIVRRDPGSCSGNLFTDAEVLAAEGVTDLGDYRTGDEEPEPSWFLPDHPAVAP